MSLNPYAYAVVGMDAVEVMATAPQRLAELVGRLSGAEVEARPAPGKWNVREVVAHLADCEIAFGFRLRQGLAGVSIQPFEQDDWAKVYAAYTVEAGLATYAALRAWNVAFIEKLTAEERAVKVTHPERGEMVLWTIVETMAGHDRHHLRGLEGE
jgi:uncharacterized damage-inducible protein DinB